MQEHTLWKNVVLQNVIDSLGVFQWFSRLNKKYHIEAKDWMGSKDFNLVCSYANLEPDFITKIYHETKKTEIIIRFINFNSEQEAIDFAEVFKHENTSEQLLTQHSSTTLH